MIWIRSEEEVDTMIEDMIRRSKGRYITQGVTFSKKCPRQMHLLKMALMSSASFSGLGKEMLAIRFSDATYTNSYQPIIIEETKTRPKNLGNFI